MTKQQLYDLILLQLGLDTQDRRSDPRIVFFSADTVRGGAIPDYINTYGESAIELFCVTKLLDVQTDTVRNKKYVQLPTQILGMKDRSGLIQVALAQDERSSFVAVQLGMMSVYSKLEAGGAAGNIIYWLEGTRIYFDNLGAGMNQILVKSIPSITDLTDGDIIPQPYEFNNLLVEGTKLAIMNKVMIADTINDTRPGV